MKLFKGFVDNFQTWTLRRQMQFLFVTSGSLICIVFIVITKFQLDWLREKVIRSSYETIEDRAISQMRGLARVQAEFVASEIDNFVIQTGNLHYLDTVINGFYYLGTNPWIQGSASDSKLSSSKLNYNQGAYYSRNELSSLGQEKVSNESCLNTFYPLLFSSSLTGLFQGYGTDEILYFYPEVQRKTDYTPLNAEWFYIASNTSQEFSITEPYSVGTNGWVSAFSKAIVLNDEVVAVAALNGSLDYFVSRITESRIFDSGFLILIGKQGVVLNTPETWKFSTTSNYPRIFDKGFSGISDDKWKSFSSSEDGSQHRFTDAQGKEFEIVKHGVYSEYLGLTHYLLACVQKKTLEEYSTDTDEDFSRVYNALFWAILACGLFTFCLGSVLIFFVARSQSIQLKLIKGVFQKLLKKAILFGQNSRTESKMLQDFSEGFETLYDACRIRLNKLEEVESGYVSHAWDYKKPGDSFLYQSWEGRFYPFNYYSGKSFKWRNAITKLKLNLADYFILHHLEV